MFSIIVLPIIHISDRFSLLASLKSSTLTSSGQTSNEQQHNVIRMSSVNVRFPLLPVSSVSGQQRRGRQTRDALPVQDVPAAPRSSAASLAVQQTPSRSSSTSSSSRRRSKSPAAKTSASFFGSMGSSWFGGKWDIRFWKIKIKTFRPKLWTLVWSFLKTTRFNWFFILRFFHVKYTFNRDFITFTCFVFCLKVQSDYSFFANSKISENPIQNVVRERAHR